MDIVWKYTSFLRKQYFDNFKSFSIKIGIALIITIIATCLFDVFFDFTGIYNVIRAFLVLIGGFIIFTAGYLTSFFFSQAKRIQNPEYLTIKERFSPSWRKRIGIIVGASLLAIIFSASHSVVYTLVNCIVVAVFGALVIFLTLTNEEVDREHYGVPDARDNVYNANLKRIQEQKIEKKQKKKEKKNN